MENNTFTGALEDTRSEEEKKKDWRNDVAFAGVPDWKEKNFDQLKTFPVRDQDGSGSCVAQTLALMLGIENFLEEGRFIEFSAKDIYTRRSNQDSAGMIGVEALEIARKYGATLEVLIPSQRMGETEINNIIREVSDEQIGKIFTIKNHYQIPFSAEKIAAIMDLKIRDGVNKPVMVWFRFPRAEWNAIPEVSNSTYDLVHHSVTAIAYGIVAGKKGIFIQDSWGLHSSTVNGLRFISEDYIKARMTFCAYVNDNKNDWQEETPETVVNRPVLKFGATGEYVNELQKILQKLGHFPASSKTTFYFGTVTLNSVKKFQSENGLVADGIVGRLTWSKLLEKNV